MRSSFLLCSLLIACGSGGSGSTGTTGTSSGGTSSGSVGPGGGSLDGKWDVIGHYGGTEDVGTITVSATQFEMAFSGFAILANLPAGAAPDITTNDRGDSAKITSTHSEEPFSAGEFSLPLGGNWNLVGTHPGEQCTSLIKPDSTSLTCSGLRSPYSRWIVGTSTSQRTSTLASSFGDLGGKWTIASPRASCTATFENTTFSAECTEIGSSTTGSVTLTFNGTTASGTTSGGGELSAQKR